MKDQLHNELMRMASAKKNKKIVAAQYNGKMLRTRSGKSSWPSKGAAKSAIHLHFDHMCTRYVYDMKPGQRWPDYSKYTPEESKIRKKEFWDTLWSMVEFKELDEG